MAYDPNESVILWTVGDVEAILGRRPTDDELVKIRRTIGYSNIGQEFYEIVEECRDKGRDNPNDKENA